MDMLNGLGAGILLLTMTTWTMRSVPPGQAGLRQQRLSGRAVLRVIVDPLLVVALQERMGGTRAAAVAVIGVVLMVLAGVAVVVVAILGRQRGVPTPVIGVASSR